MTVARNQVVTSGLNEAAKLPYEDVRIRLRGRQRD